MLKYRRITGMGRTKMTTITNTATRECLKVNETSHIEVAGQKDQNVYPIEDKKLLKTHTLWPYICT